MTVFDKDRTIAWLPGQLDETGQIAPGGWKVATDLAPTATETDVTTTYAWTDYPAEELRDQIGGMPPFDSDALAESLAALDRAAVIRRAPGPGTRARSASVVLGVGGEHVEADHHRLGVARTETPLETRLLVVGVRPADQVEHMARELGLHGSRRRRKYRRAHSPGSSGSV